MRVLVCGGRSFRSPAQVNRKLDEIHAATPITALIQGGATGADSFAKQWARTKPGIARYQANADWEDLSHPDAVIRTRPDGTKYDAMAGVRRNTRMLTWKPDLVVAFAGGKGTRNMIEQARAAAVRVLEIK